MIKLGQYNTLRIDRFCEFGAYLADDAKNPESVLMPRRYVSDSMSVGDIVDVFVYLDSEERPVATTEKPFAQVGQFVYLQAVDVNKYGAFLDWGLTKQLLVPFREQTIRMRPGGIYLVYVYLDNASGRIVASMKIDKFLGNVYPDYTRGRRVEALVYAHSPIGYNVIVDNLHKGMIYDNELFRPLELETTVTAYVKNVRDDGKIDLTLTAPGTSGRIRKVESNILRMLQSGTFILTDKSSPEEIAKVLQCSKKDFKKAVGELYKAKKIVIGSDSSISLAQ